MLFATHPLPCIPLALPINSHTVTPCALPSPHLPTARVADLVRKLKIGDGLEAGVTLGPLISKYEMYCMEGGTLSRSSWKIFLLWKIFKVKRFDFKCMVGRVVEINLPCLP